MPEAQGSNGNGVAPPPIAYNVVTFTAQDHVDVGPLSAFTTVLPFNPIVTDGALVTINITNQTATNFTIQASAEFTGYVAYVVV